MNLDQNLILSAEQDTPPRGIGGYQEYRVGSRLERVSVRRGKRIIEEYKNNRRDTVWSDAENEIGEVPNMRHWVIGNW